MSIRSGWAPPEKDAAIEREDQAIIFQLRIDEIINKINEGEHVTLNEVKQANIKKKFLPNFRKIYIHKIIWKVSNILSNKALE